VFTSSVDATHRLYLLLRALPTLNGAVVEYSGLVAPPERAAALGAFRAGHAKVGRLLAKQTQHPATELRQCWLAALPAPACKQQAVV
jgi:hypothetical protein